MRRARRLLERPISDHDRRRAFAVAATALLLAAIALSIFSEPADRPAAGANDRPPIARPESMPTPTAGDLPAETLHVARRFLDGYLACLYGSRRPGEIQGATDRLRRRLAAQPVRVSPAMRRARPRVERIDGQPFADGWLIDATVAAGTVEFPISVVVADRPGGPVVTRVVED